MSGECQHNVSFQWSPPDGKGIQEMRCGSCHVLLELWMANV